MGLLFVTGGSRSGKSAFAEYLVVQHLETASSAAVYIATLETGDAEVAERIERHRTRRPAGWTTIEAPLDLVAALREAPPAACVLIDSVSVWVANRLLALGDEPAAADIATLEAALDKELEALVAAAAAREAATIVVSDETGSGVVPAYRLGRVYRDLLGRVNEHLSRAAERAWLVVAGRALELPPPFANHGASEGSGHRDERQ